jgi:hypothetical protein
MDDILVDISTDATKVFKKYIKKNEQRIHYIVDKLMTIIVGKLKYYYIVLVLLLLSSTIINFIQFYFHLTLLRPLT